MITRKEILTVMEQNKEIPTLIDVYQHFREKISDPRTPATEIADMISSDQAIATRVLRSANSPFYGLMNRVTTIPHAIVIIGFNGIHHIVLNTAVLNLFRDTTNRSREFDPHALWRHSSATGLIARLIAKKIRYSAFEELFTAGLLHDIGKIYLFRYFLQDYLRVITTAKEKNILLKDAEEQILGITHSEIGGALLKAWNIPETLIYTTTFHHNLALAKDKIKAACVVHLADILCRSLEIGSGGDEKVPLLNADAWAQLDLEPAMLNDIVDELNREIDNFNVFGSESV